ncbi:MAG: hypothetical protein K8R46_14670 [Pirellulales bacterium]|nr:hypothetical protein [Pirellulales bacterium]
MSLFAQVHDSLFAYVFSLLPHWSDAEDVFQQTSLVLWRKFGSFQPTAKKGTGPICRNGPEGASHKLDLSPFLALPRLGLPGGVFRGAKLPPHRRPRPAGVRQRSGRAVGRGTRRQPATRRPPPRLPYGLHRQTLRKTARPDPARL